MKEPEKLIAIQKEIGRDWGFRVLTVKLKRNGWPEDEEPQWMDEALLEYSEPITEDENEIVRAFEWRLDGKIVKRGAHVTLKKNVVAEGIAAMLGG